MVRRSVENLDTTHEVNSASRGTEAEISPHSSILRFTMAAPRWPNDRNGQPAASVTANPSSSLEIMTVSSHLPFSLLRPASAGPPTILHSFQCPQDILVLGNAF